MKSKNPLFVITGNGDVEQANDFFDALVKKYGLAPLIEIFNSIFDFIVDNVKGHQAVVFLNTFLDEFVSFLETMLKVIDPVLAFKFFKK